ncbi:Methyltransferase domain-containing protein [Amphibacillus marinus]|uniref:Methyltransferase domain-containing protein n=1 Tax=Amphibacillus marinus TaxID=872970 RepID=A0A1H8NT79_9BACI|nr:class I SAM-dependent methyltransferase [Amphibacillus marinus]SEO32821.1 Methyltransferase domain-containing protein [Amphibacillus marinus]
MAYQDLAMLYDRLMADAPYEQWVSFTEFCVRNYNLKPANQLLDLGCGTGRLTCQLAEAGYTVTGVDLSEHMLTEASARALNANLAINWIKQDISKLEGFQDLDIIVSYCDVINYLPGEESVRAALHAIAQSLRNQGLFIFDVHSIKHVRDNMVNQVFSEVADDFSYIWFCEQGSQIGEMIHDLTFFVKDRTDSVYHRFEEQHNQLTYSALYYQQLLYDAGFSTIDIFANFQQTKLVADQADEQGDRLFFVCKK